MGSIWNGKEVTEQEYWKLRLSQIIEEGCTVEDLRNLMVDLEMSDLTGEETYQVPSVILEIPVYTYDENDNIVECDVSEVEEDLERISSVTEVCGYNVYSNRWVMTYIPKK